MTVAVAAQRLASPLLAEIRAACKALNLDIEEWTGGIPRTPPQLVVTALEPGERRLPDDLCQLIEASPGVRAIVCAAEALVKPRITLNQGRVVVLAPPVDRVRLIAVARSVLGTDERSPTTTDDTRRFEILRRQYWVAWARGSDAAKARLDEQSGMTLMLGQAAANGTVGRVLNKRISDAAQGAKLAERVGDVGAVIHLLEDADEWLVYWPRHSPLWICSPQRLPTRWDATPTVANATEKLVRIQAFPGDQVIGMWSPEPIADDVLAPIKASMLEGGPETFAKLALATDQLPGLTGLVVELR